jgi:hypothetical protein
MSLPVLFSSSSSSAAACREMARSLPRSELGSTTLRTLGSIGSHEGATRSMTKRMHLRFTLCPLIFDLNAGKPGRCPGEEGNAFNAFSNKNENGISLHRTRHIITGELNKHRTNHSLIYHLYNEPGSPRCHSIIQNGLSSVVTSSPEVHELAGGIVSPSSSSDAFAVVSPNRAGIGTDLPLKGGLSTRPNMNTALNILTC